jgi:hypothetical protein
MIAVFSIRQRTASHEFDPNTGTDRLNAEHNGGRLQQATARFFCARKPSLPQNSFDPDQDALLWQYHHSKTIGDLQDSEHEQARNQS